MSTVMAAGDTSGKPSAREFEAFFLQHYQLVYRTAYSVTGRQEDAEDIVQTLFLKLLRRDSPMDLGSNPDGSRADKWRAILEPVGDGKVRGGAMVEAQGDESTHFTITIRNAAPNTGLAWHLHSGTCAAPGGVVGAGYPELHSGPGGTAEAAVTLAVSPPTSGNYVIQVHGPTGAPISCGALKPIGEGTS